MLTEFPDGRRMRYAAPAARAGALIGRLERLRRRAFAPEPRGCAVTAARLTPAPGAPPTSDDIDAIARRVFDALPAAFRALSEGVVIQVVDFPDEETLKEMNAESEFDLLGLFRGRGLAQSAASLPTGAMPNMVWLYRRPLLDYWCDGEDTLEEVVAHVLIHEIGHHFGLSDDDMEAIEASVR